MDLNETSSQFFKIPNVVKLKITLFFNDWSNKTMYLVDECWSISKIATC